MYMMEWRFRVVYMNFSTLLQNIVANFNSRGLSRVVCIFFKSCSENSKDFVFEIEIQRFEDSQEEIFLSILIHLDNRIPVISNLIQSLYLSKINKSQYILLKTTSSKSNTTIQKLITDPSISRDTLLDLFDISLILLANNGNAINRWDSLS